MRSWILSTLVALGPPGDPGGDPGAESSPDSDAISRVEIDVAGLELHMSDATLHGFHGDLLMRLLEAGHGVGRGGAIQLSLRSTGAAIVVECRVGETSETILVEDADAPVLVLELVHRAVDLVGVCAPTDRSFDRDAIMIDGEALEPAEMSELLVELAEQPISLVANEDAAGWRLCVSEDRSAAIVIPIERSCDTTAEALDAGLGDAPTVAIQRWREPEPTEPEPEPTGPEPEPEPEPTEPTEHPPRPRRPWGASVGVAAGIQLRLPGAAANLRADVAAIHPSGLVVGVAGLLTPSRAEQLTVTDGLALATIGWRAVLTDRLVIRPSLGLGLAIHRFGFPGEGVDHQLDPAVRVPIELELKLATRTFLSVAIAGSFATRRIEHRLEDALIWTRGVVRLEALIGLRFDWLDLGARRSGIQSP